MVSFLNFKSLSIHYLTHKILLFSIFFLVFWTAPALTQVYSKNRVCQYMEQDLHQINHTIIQNSAHNARYIKLVQMQKHARNDAIRYSCYSDLFRKGSSSEACRYIMSSQQRIETALSKLSNQAATVQQKQIKLTIYQHMQANNCRSPQSLDQLMNENRKATPRKRRKASYKKHKPLSQVVKFEPAIIENNIASDTAHQIRTPAVPELKNTKAAEKTPPPLFFDAVDYVPDPTIRRVGPEYIPAQ